MTDHDKKKKEKQPCSTVKQRECTQVLLNIPRLLLLNRLIERVGARPLTSLPLEKLREEETNKKKTREAAQSINESTCPRGSSRGKNRVR